MPNAKMLQKRPLGGDGASIFPAPYFFQPIFKIFAKKRGSFAQLHNQKRNSLIIRRILAHF